MKRALTTLCVIAASVLLLPVFSLAGSATISWSANTDEDLAGYRIYYSTAKGGPYGSSTALIPKTQTRYAVTNLSDGTYYFVVTAVDTSNNESSYSSEVSKKIASTTTSTASSTPSPATTPASTPTSSSTTTASAAGSTTSSAATSASTPIATAQAPKTPAPVKPAPAPTGTASSPIPLPAAGQYGMVSGNASQSGSVNFTFSGRKGNVTVYYKGYDVNSKKEVSILVNGKRVGYAKKTKKKKWGAGRSITVKDTYVNDSGSNILTFQSSTARWGVGGISVR